VLTTETDQILKHIVLYDPVLASLTLSLTVGVFLVAAGVMRAWAGFNTRPVPGWRWIVAAGGMPRP
jgi:uncharacterized membrane protein HdeD (DUF308 family)